MTSDLSVQRTQLYVWIWLPGVADPVVAGVLTDAQRTFEQQPVLTFAYARSYRERPDAITLFGPDLPLRRGTFDPTRPGEVAEDSVSRPTGRDGSSPPRRRSPVPLHGCLRDAAPDAWGRRVLNLRLAGTPETNLSDLTYFAESSSDRVGALDFQESATRYVARGDGATLEQMLHVAELVEAGQELPLDLAAAAGHGTSIGGARPKALLDDGDRHLIAKFASSTDTRPVVKAEAVAMLLAARVGIDVAPVEICQVNGKDVMLVERFDRGPGGTRRLMVSALTILGLGEMESWHATYAELADEIRFGPWVLPADTLRELFTRLVFNVAVGNNDDHLRNHAAFWDGAHLELTPAYDLAPQPRSTQVSSQAIGIARDGRRHSQLWLCREVAPTFMVPSGEAVDIVDHIVSTIRSAWEEVCDQARLTRAERSLLWGREFLNPYIFYDQP